MDVLELPRPVINFLRTMAKESCRYALSWDIFGGPDSVTLTLTWKLIEDESQSSIINEASSLSSTTAAAAAALKQQQNYEDPHIRTRTTVKNSNSSSSPRRSRRDDHTSTNENASVPAIFRSSRGKSLEDPHIPSNKQITSLHHQQTKEHQHVSSLERSPMPNHYHHRTKKEPQKPVSVQSDQIYGNLYNTRSPSVVKCATISSLSSSSPSPQPNITTNTPTPTPTPTNNNNNNPPLSTAYSHHQRIKQQQQQYPQQKSITPPTLRKPIRPVATISRTPTIPMSSHTSSNYAKLKRADNIAMHNDVVDDDDDDDTLDPWVKRFECSLEDNDDDETTEQLEEKEHMPPATATITSMDDSANTSGKVKFKTKPDYF
ncbi:unnamed protein product [Adineta steineri]|uniref:Uncharacterized protein n=1 Tax=Adineta steineri TaxID=433720 RepID=A0A815LAY0_9BILA|nr:unnamed protein product [Adineta steineri]CAF3525963.1 unnamed protein product [Adineta steineri]